MLPCTLPDDHIIPSPLLRPPAAPQPCAVSRWPCFQVTGTTEATRKAPLPHPDPDSLQPPSPSTQTLCLSCSSLSVPPGEILPPLSRVSFLSLSSGSSANNRLQFLTFYQKTKAKQPSITNPLPARLHLFKRKFGFATSSPPFSLEPPRLLQNLFIKVTVNFQLSSQQYLWLGSGWGSFSP